MVSKIPFSVRYMGIIGHYTVKKIQNENGRGQQVSQNTRIAPATGGFYALFSLSYGLNLTGLPNR